MMEVGTHGGYVKEMLKSINRREGAKADWPGDAGLAWPHSLYNYLRRRQARQRDDEDSSRVELRHEEREGQAFPEPVHVAGA